MDIWNRFLYIIGFVLGLLGFLAGPLSASAEAAPVQPSFTYGEGITSEQFYRTYHQTLCYDYVVVKGSLESVIASDLVVESNGLYYRTNAGLSWGACPTIASSAPDFYVTSCAESIGDMKRTYGWDQVRGWITDANGTVVTYLIHATDATPCDASAVPLFDNTEYPNWQTACTFGPVLFVMNGTNARCDVNPIRVSGA